MRRALWLTVATAVLAGSASALAARPLETAVLDLQVGSADMPAAYARVTRLGARKMRIFGFWSAIAPAQRPPGFDPSNPDSPGYNWSSLDRQISLAYAAGLDPIVALFSAPPWAEQSKSVGINPGTRMPNPAEYGRFAAAAARRYDGSGALPRVRYWQVWNEPNLTDHLAPQYVGRKPFSPILYRRMVNAFAAAVKGVHADNVVVAGGTSPFRDIRPEVQKVNPRWGPLTFMRSLFCLNRQLERVCRSPVRFDIWAHHPYTSGGPTHHALLPDDVSLGDLPQMRAVLKAAYSAGNVKSPRMPGFWVTEFSWDSAPPDPEGLPIKLHARWTAEALYRMWKAGVSLVTWLELRDQPWGDGDPDHYVQGGLYFRGQTFRADRAKPAAQAFRFPFVAYKHARGIRFWGRTPTSARATVIVEQKAGRGWRRLWSGSAAATGIFQGTLAERAGNASVRARILPGGASLPFSLVAPPDRAVCPFGSCEVNR